MWQDKDDQVSEWSLTNFFRHLRTLSRVLCSNKATLKWEHILAKGYFQRLKILLNLTWWAAKINSSGLFVERQVYMTPIWFSCLKKILIGLSTVPYCWTICPEPESLTTLEEKGKFQLCSSNLHEAEVMRKTISLCKSSEEKPSIVLCGAHAR